MLTTWSLDLNDNVSHQELKITKIIFVMDFDKLYILSCLSFVVLILLIT
jgi:hypothetical protein